MVNDLWEAKPLTLAIQRGHMAAAELLLEHASYHGKDKILSSALYDLLDNHAFPRRFVSTNLESIKLLIDKGASPNYISLEAVPSYSLLHLAAISGECESVKLLISRGADPMQRNNYGLTSLHVASAYGKIEAIDILLKNGAAVNAQTYGGSTPLHYAIDGVGNLQTGVTEDIAIGVVNLLLQSGADVNKQTFSGETGLHQSAKSGLSGIVKLLLEHDTELEVKDDQNWTALEAAAACGQITILKQLLAPRGQTDDPFLGRLLEGARLCKAAAQGDKYAVQQLHDLGAALVCDVKGYSALHLAANQGHDEIVEMLLKTGMEVDKRTAKSLRQYDTFGHPSKEVTALHLAAKKGHIATLKLLIKMNADVNSRDVSGGTSLYWSSCYGHSEYVELLLEKNADITIGVDGFSQLSKDVITPLSAAASNGQEAVVRLLLAHGADVEAKGKNGK